MSSNLKNQDKKGFKAQKRADALRENLRKRKPASKKKTEKKPDSGFTLVELAIVMIVIGLLIGGVIKGQAFIEQAKLKNTITYINNLDLALLSFRDSYNTLPGDISDATIRIPNCSAATNCSNGDGNGVIGNVNGRDGIIWSSIIPTSCNPNPSQPCWLESNLVWKHLVLANLITDVDPSSDPASPSWDVTHPRSPMSPGGFEIYYDGYMVTGAGASSSESAGHLVRISYHDFTTFNTSLPGTTPVQASGLDNKLDNGDPNSGYIFANYGRRNDNCKSTIGGVGQYATTDVNADYCAIYIRMFQ